jgi:hypothetical protein
MRRVAEHGGVMRDVSGASRAPLRVAPVKNLELNNRGEGTRLMLDQNEP